MEKEILQVIAIVANDQLYRQVYASELKMLFDMLRREQGTYLQDDSLSTIIAGVDNTKALQALENLSIRKGFRFVTTPKP